MAYLNCLLTCKEGLMPSESCMQWLIVFVCESMCKHNIGKAL